MNTNSYRFPVDLEEANEVIRVLRDELAAVCVALGRSKDGTGFDVDWHGLGADVQRLRAGPTREAEIRADEARQIMFALDHYKPASDYGPPITERIALHERGATNRTFR